LTWTISWTKTAEKQFSKIDPKNAQKIITALDEIVDEPLSFIEKLVGPELYKLRVGNYRVILSLEGKKMIIFVVDAGHRKKIYKKY